MALIDVAATSDGVGASGRDVTARPEAFHATSSCPVGVLFPFLRDHAGRGGVWADASCRGARRGGERIRCRPPKSDAITARNVEPEGARRGIDRFTDADGRPHGREVDGLPPGFHGFHVHAVQGLLNRRQRRTTANPISWVNPFQPEGTRRAEPDHGAHAG